MGDTYARSMARRALAELQRRRPMSTSPQMSGVPGLAGEATRLTAATAGDIFGWSKPVLKALDKSGIIVDALGNGYAAYAGNPAGKSKYGFLRPDLETGVSVPVDPSGFTGPSVASDLAEGSLQAAQLTGVGAIPGIALAGENTENQINEAMRQRVPALERYAAIEYTGGDAAEGQIMAMDRAIKDLSVMNKQRPAYSGRTGEPLFQSLDEASEADVATYLRLARQDLDSGDEAAIRRAALMIKGASAAQNRHYANMEAITDSTQEWTWPWKRAGEWVNDEMGPYFSGNRMLETLSGKIGLKGETPIKRTLEYLNPFGKNFADYKRGQKWEGVKERNQGTDLLDELDQRAFAGTGGEDPVQVRNNKISAEKADRARRAPAPLGGPRKKKLLSQEQNQINE